MKPTFLQQAHDFSAVLLGQSRFVHGQHIHVGHLGTPGLFSTRTDSVCFSLTVSPIPGPQAAVEQRRIHAHEAQSSSGRPGGS